MMPPGHDIRASGRGRPEPREYADAWSNVPESNVDLGFDADTIYVAPLFLDRPIRVATVSATVLRLSGTPTVGAAIYRILTPDKLVRDFASTETQYLSAGVFALELMRKLNVQLMADADGPERYFTTIAPELVLDPDRGMFAIAWQSNASTMRWRGGRYSTMQHAGFVAQTSSSMAWPTSLTVKQGDTIPVPSFTFQSIRGARHVGR